MQRVSRNVLCTAVMAIALCGGTAVAQPPPPPVPPLPPVPFPPQNPFSESKRVLGKILFWDEQLSSDNTVACGTCHINGRGGTDPRLGLHPGLDNLPGTPDDKAASPGMHRSDANRDLFADPVFGFQTQVTPRAANPAIFAMYAPALFWDGRAPATFTDPQSGLITITNFGALESQALAPVLSPVEMGHDGRTWEDVAAKLASVTPLILARDIPPDMLAALETHATYPALFAAAFGDEAITAQRIAFAIATYERTLLPNDTPWDRFNAGDVSALTPSQAQGWNAFRASPCSACHPAPQFTNHTFQNIGLRPIPEDNGRQSVTGNAADRGRFKVPTLRNVGLKPTYMHHGAFNSIQGVVAFYANPAAQFPNNLSPLLPVALPQNIAQQVVDFLTNGLTDARVAGEQFPFDRPQLYSEREAPNPLIVSGGVAGSGTFTPAIIAASPPNSGNADFRVGLAGALGGSQAFLALSESPPEGPVLVADVLYGPFPLPGAGVATGFATWHHPIDELVLSGCHFYVQWQVIDPAAPGGMARSPVARMSLIPNACAGDLTCDGRLDGHDLTAFVQALLDPSAYEAEYPACNLLDADINEDGAIDVDDAISFAQLLTALP